jgi:hypothetical protein
MPREKKLIELEIGRGFIASSKALLSAERIPVE